MELLNGAFTATFTKGKDGRSKWEFIANLPRIGKKVQNAGSMKEKPQFAVINEIEGAAVSEFQQNLKTTTIDITKYLLTLVKQ